MINPLHAEVLAALKVYCNTHGHLKEILYDSGKDCCNLRMNNLMQNFVQESDIKLNCGSARTPTTQGLAEHSNRTCKEDMRIIIMRKAHKDLGQHHMSLYHSLSV